MALVQCFLPGRLFIKILKDTELTRSKKGNVKKKWRVTTEYQPNRLAVNHLVDTYEKLFPKSKYKMSLNKKTDTDNDLQLRLNQIQRNTK